MCFYADYDWRAETVEKSAAPAEQRFRCDECFRWFNAGEMRHHIHMQEHEQCQRCEDDCRFDYDPDHPDCQGGEHDYGETFEYECCEECHLIRQAIRRVEEAEGCTGVEAEPALGQMSEDVCNGEGWPHYADEMLRLGLNREAELVGRRFLAPHRVLDDELWVNLADGSARVAAGQRYRHAHCDTHSDEPLTVFDDLGGEGG